MRPDEEGPGALAGAIEATVNRLGGRSQATPRTGVEQQDGAPIVSLSERQAEALAGHLALVSVAADRLVTASRYTALTMRNRAASATAADVDAPLAGEVAEHAERLRARAKALEDAQRAAIGYIEATSGHAARCGTMRRERST